MKQINSYQKSLYEKYDLEGSKRYFNRYKDYLGRFAGNDCVRILDIGGASGFFACVLKEYFETSGKVEVYVVDNTEYDTWAEDALGSEIHFIHDSVENIGKIFDDNTFDIVFANRVFHHFIDRTYRQTLRGMETYISMIRDILKEDGLFCIMDHFYDGLILDTATSRLIYTYTTIKTPVLASIFRNMGAMTAGVGVCFQSEKMWGRTVKKCNFKIAHVERTCPDQLSLVKRIGLLCKNVSRNNIIIATPIK